MAKKAAIDKVGLPGSQQPQQDVPVKTRTKGGVTQLFHAAKSGQFDDIPKHLRQIELFLIKNNREENPLHIAAKHGHLNKIPPEFLTIKTLTALDCYGRTPLHVAANYGHADQIPKEFLTPSVLSIPTKNYTSNTILHCAAESNTLDLLPKDCLTPELFKIENGYGLTPLQSLKDHQPTKKQLSDL